MKYGAPVYCLAVQTKQLSWSTKCTTSVLVKHGTPVYCLAVQVKQLSWGAKRTTGVPWFLLQNCNLKRDSTHLHTFSSDCQKHTDLYSSYKAWLYGKFLT